MVCEKCEKKLGKVREEWMSKLSLKFVVALAANVAMLMRQVPLERDINIAVNGCSGFATSTQKGPFMAMLISRSRGTYLIHP